MAQAGGTPAGEVRDAARLQPALDFGVDSPLPRRPEAPASMKSSSHRQGHVFSDGELVEKGRTLEGTPEAEPSTPPRGKGSCILFAQMHQAFGWPQLTGDHIEKRGFAGAIGADYGAALAGGDVDVNPAQRGHGPETHRHARHRHAPLGQAPRTSPTRPRGTKRTKAMNSEPRTSSHRRT